MGIIKKVILYLINLFFTGFIPMMIIINIMTYIQYKEFILGINTEIRGLISALIGSFIVKYLIKGFIELYYGYKEIFKTRSIGISILTTILTIIMVYGVYYRATR